MYKAYLRQFVDLFVPVLEDKSNHIYKYGHDNLLPNKLIQYINDSGVAKRAVNKVATYIGADGFVDEAAKVFKINDKQTAEQLLELVKYDLAYFNSFSLLIGRDAYGNISSVKHIPFQYVRKTLQGDFLVNTTLGSKDYKKDKNIYYAPFFGQKATPQDMMLLNSKYKNSGEIFYSFYETPDNPHYPVPDYYASIEDVRTSSELQKFDLEASLNGFVPSALLTIVGEVDNKVKDDWGKTSQDYLNETLETFTGKIKDADGLSNRNALMVLSAKNKDEIPNLQAFDAKAIIDASTSKREAIERSVCRLFGVHPVLVGFSDAAILGNTQAISNASLELNNNVNPLQRMFERAMKIFYPTVDWAITKFTPVNYISNELYAVMTEDEKRALAGLAPIERQIPSEGEKILATLNGLSPLLATKVIDMIPQDVLLSALGIKTGNTQQDTNVQVA